MAGRTLILVLFLLLLFRQPVVPEARDLRPSMHGLPYQRQVGIVPPSTVSFFRNSSTVALPEGLDADGGELGPSRGGAPSGSVPFFPARRRPVGDCRRAKILLVVAVVCAVVAVALLCAALCAVFCRARSRK